MDSRLSSKRVLIVEDNEHDFQLMKRVLNKEAVTNIVHALSAEEALCILSKDIAFDLVIMDINLSKSGLNGIDVLHEIKTTKKMSKIKTVVISGDLDLLQQTSSADLSFRKHRFTELMRYMSESLSLLK